MRSITKGKLLYLSIIPTDKAFPHCRITNITTKEYRMSDEKMTDEQAAQVGVNPETGEPDNPEHGTYENPITTDYNTENVDTSTAKPTENPKSDSSEPAAVDVTADTNVTNRPRY